MPPGKTPPAAARGPIPGAGDGADLLRAEGVAFHFGHGGGGIEGLDLAVRPGEFLGILGPNGSGKTTFLRTLSGFHRPTRGRVLLGGRDLHDLPPRERAREVAVVSDMARVLFFSSFACRELVLLGRLPYLGRLQAPGRRDREIANRALEGSGIAHLADKRFDSISSGERQKVLIAAALCQEPKLLLMDEPTVHLDVRGEIEVFRIVEHLRAQRGITVIAVLHDLQRAARSCDRVLLLRDGRAAAIGPPGKAMTPGILEAVFGVRLRREERGGRITFEG